MLAPMQRSRSRRPSVLVLGDLVVDVVLAPGRPLETGSDVPGTVALRQGGSATTTARWLGRGGARVGLIAAIGRDAAGRGLVATIRADGVIPRVVRLAGERTGRIGVLVSPNGERSFVQDRGAATRLAPEHLRPDWFARLDLLHLPVYSILEGPLGEAGRRAASLAHDAGALVTLDLSSTAPLLAYGRTRAIELIDSIAPDLILATVGEARALVRDEDRLLRLAPAVVLKRGADGATVLHRERSGRFDVATTAVPAGDTTGAGDAFAGGFILGWLAARAEGASTAVSLRRGAIQGNRTAIRQLTAPRQELALG